MTISPNGELHRISPSRTPWEAYKGTTFAARFDDPDRHYFVLYASSSRLGCFVECLAYFRVEPDKPGFTELESKFGNSFPEGTVPPKWCLNRLIQKARVEGDFADVAHSEWIALLLKNFPERLHKDMKYPWVDQSTIYQDKFRSITQWISRFVFESDEKLAGLYYTSKLGADFSNWAIFEGRAMISIRGVLEPIAEHDLDLLRACTLLGIHPPTGAIIEPVGHRLVEG